MSKIRSKGTTLELQVRQMLRALGARGDLPPENSTSLIWSSLVI